MADQRTGAQLSAAVKFGASVGAFGPGVIGDAQFKAEQAALAA